MPANKELKLTKPSVLELRSLTPVFGGLDGREMEMSHLLLFALSLAAGTPEVARSLARLRSGMALSSQLSTHGTVSTTPSGATW